MKVSAGPVRKPGKATGDWREETLGRLRALILEADPEMIEERKWRAIDIHEGEMVDPRAFKALVKAAGARNGRSAKKR